MTICRLAACFAVALGCSHAAVAQDAPPSYTKDIRPFLTKYCMECHKSTNAKAGLSVETYDAIMKGSRKRKAVVPGKADESRLVTTVEGRTRPVMPPKNKAKPNEKEIATLRAWIAAGAKDDTPTGAHLIVPMTELLAIDLPLQESRLRLTPVACHADACPTDSGR
jgi:hypothetical protein